MDENSSTAPSRFTVFGRGSYTEALRIGAILRKETEGGSLLVAAALIALIWANSPASESYFAVGHGQRSGRRAGAAAPAGDLHATEPGHRPRSALDTEPGADRCHRTIPKHRDRGPLDRHRPAVNEAASWLHSLDGGDAGKAHRVRLWTCG